jgi:4-aminobutyrate aminotransferase-like enzyme
VFSCSGTEGIEVAIQVARLVTGNRGLLCTDATYHGNTELVASMSYLGCPDDQHGEIRSFPFPERYRPLEEGLSDDELSQAYLARVEAAIDSLERDGHGVAALLVCSIFANEGVPDIPAGFMARVTDLVHGRGGLVIADEVQSGLGRTGCWWGYEKVGFTPDLVVGGKPMGNGLPLGATLAKREHIEAFRAAKDYFNTCAASPLQAAVGMAVLDEIQRLDLVNNAAEVGDRLTNRLRERMGRFEAIGDVRGSGLFISVELVKDRGSKEPARHDTITLGDRLKDKGFLVSYSGKYENVLKIRPPLVFSHANADDFLVAFDACMEAVYG